MEDVLKRKTGAENPFQRLPDTVCTKIFSNLTQISGLCAIQSTCTRFQSLVEKVESLSFEADDFRHTMKSSIETIVTRKVLNTSSLRRLHVANPAQAPNLQEVAVMAWCLHCRDSLEALTLIDSPADPASRHLLATQEWKLAQASFCSQLRRLDLHNVCFDFQDGLHCRRFERLEHLTLRNAVVIGEVVEELLSRCPKVETVQLLSCSGLGPLDLIDTPTTSLRRFELVLDEVGELELLRLNAPNLEALLVVVDCLPGPVAEEEQQLWGSVQVQAGRLLELHLDLTSSSNLRIAPATCAHLQRLQLMGDEWQWGVVAELLHMGGPTLEVLNLGASLLLPSTLNPALFFLRLPTLQYLSLGSDLFLLLGRSLEAGEDRLFCPCLQEVHVEFVMRVMEEVRLAAALLRDCPRLVVLQPIYHAVQVQVQVPSGACGAQEGEEWRAAIAQLRLQHPRVNLM